MDKKQAAKAAKRAFDEYRTEMAKEDWTERLKNGDRIGLTKQTNFDDPQIGMSIGGHVKQMIGEYERQRSTSLSGNYVDNDEIGTDVKW